MYNVYTCIYNYITATPCTHNTCVHILYTRLWDVHVLYVHVCLFLLLILKQSSYQLLPYVHWSLLVENLQMVPDDGRNTIHVCTCIHGEKHIHDYK